MAVDEEVAFNGSFTDPGSDDTHTIEWDFGDDTGAEDTLTPTHVYEQAGDFTVTDVDGGVGTDDLTVTVEEVVVEVVPIADAGPDQEANEGDTVRFAGAASPNTGGEIGSFDWDFGDGENDPIYLRLIEAIRTRPFAVQDSIPWTARLALLETAVRK